MANEIQIPLDPNPLGPMEPIFFTGTITPLSQVYADFVRSKLFGKHVREALARGILIASIDANEAKDIARIANAKSDETSERQDELEERWETVLAETTDGAEVIDARTGLRGTSWATLKGRLDSMQAIDDKLNPVSEIFSIEHNQNCYPVVRVLAFENGLGIGPLGVNLGGSNTITINCEAEYMGRNSLKVKVPLVFAMTNPTTERISANEYLLVEGIKSLIIEVGTKAEANVETFVTREILSDFNTPPKIAGSNVENANNLKWIHRESLILPNSTGWNAATQVYINMIYKLDNVAFVATAIANPGGLIPQALIEFNILRILEQNFPQVFNSVATVSEKVAIAKQRILAMAPIAFGKGAGPSGNKLIAQVYVANEWVGTSTNTTNTINEIGFNQINPVIAPQYVHSDGNCYLIVYGEASNETIQSSVSIDYTNITITARVQFSKI